MDNENNIKYSFEHLETWQKAHEFILLTYKYSEVFPKTETFGLTSQFRRAAVSIAANIAEGYKKTGKADKLRFYNISQSSLEECRYYILLARDLNYIPTEISNILTVAIEITSKLLNNYYRAIEKSIDK